jgi:hypothetical protein
LKWLEKHKAKGEHWISTAHSSNKRTADEEVLHMSQKPAGDILIELCQEASLSYCQQHTASRDVQPTYSRDHTVILWDGTEIVCSELRAGYASKSKLEAQHLSLAQMQFVIFAFELGEKCAADKLSPESAEELMKIVGTMTAVQKYPNEKYLSDALGDDAEVPVFKCYERMDSYTIKSHFSKANHAATVQAVAKLKRINNVPLAERFPEDLSATQLRDQLLAHGVDVAGLKVAELRKSLATLRAKTPSELATMRTQAQLANSTKLTRAVTNKRLAAMKVAEVRQELSQYSLPTSGTLKDLKVRLRDHIMTEAATQMDEPAAEATEAADGATAADIGIGDDSDSDSDIDTDPDFGDAGEPEISGSSQDIRGHLVRSVRVADYDDSEGSDEGEN